MPDKVPAHSLWMSYLNQPDNSSSTLRVQVSIPGAYREYASRRGVANVASMLSVNCPGHRHKSRLRFNV